MSKKTKQRKRGTKMVNNKSTYMFYQQKKKKFSLDIKPIYKLGHGIINSTSRPLVELQGQINQDINM